MLRSDSETCLACESRQRRHLYTLRGYEILRCTRCGLAWISGDTTRVSAIYSDKYFEGSTPEGYGNYEALKPGLQKTFAKRIAKLEGLGLNKRSALLEVGCGMGFFLELAQRHFGEVLGIEISEFAATYAREKLGLNVLNRPFETDAVQDREFDAIVLWDVIEHLPDPRAALREVHRLLRVGGWCVFSTGNIASAVARLCGPRWHLFNLPEHLFYFSPNSARQILRSCGLRVTRISSEFSYYPIFYLVERLFKTALPSRHYRNPDWLLRWGSSAIPISLGDIMTVYGVREE